MEWRLWALARSAFQNKVRNCFSNSNKAAGRQPSALSPLREWSWLKRARQWRAPFLGPLGSGCGHLALTPHPLWEGRLGFGASRGLATAAAETPCSPPPRPSPGPLVCPLPLRPPSLSSKTTASCSASTQMPTWVSLLGSQPMPLWLQSPPSTFQRETARLQEPPQEPGVRI